MSAPINFDPNLNLSGNTSIKTVRLTFGQWKYRRAVEVTVNGNTSGMETVFQAIEIARGQHFYGDKIVLYAGQSTLECENDDQEDEWLRNMLVAAEIIAIEPSGNVFDKKPAQIPGAPKLEVVK